MRELPKAYNPSEFEEPIYKKWEESGAFKPQGDGETFTIVMPPPNANGRLHAGHTLFVTLEDIMTRYHRMKGDSTLWVPGADHAGFETQIVYERKLEKEGRSRFGMDRDQLYQEIMDFTLENKQHMENDVRRLGGSCDWSREKFTLDESVIKEVHKTFKKMYDDGLVYRGKRIINWCTKHQTSLSDVEMESEERVDKLYYIKYGPMTVATVRPETIFGDVAVAVNPNDDRYKDYVGKTITVTTPIGTMELKVIGDEMVDPAFGTGALKITPAHDANDYEVGQRHNLDSIEVIDQYGKLNEKTGKYAGMKINAARADVVKDLEEMGLLEKVEDYTHVVPVCYKCGTTMEPRILDQWFVKMRPLADLAIKAVEEGKLKFIPEYSEKIFMHWMHNTIDWNISRQIVWGIRIPAKICLECGDGVPDLDDNVTSCPKCGGNVRPDIDTFDTWFSSGQWPLLVLGYPDGEDFKRFYPTDVMETGIDLIFKWVPRMVIFGLYLAKEVPFHTVYMHGMVNDAKGQKMSKSKGNVINPIDISDKYGVDALRMALAFGNAPGTALALAEDKVKGMRNFANKIWNIGRFILMNLPEDFESTELPVGNTEADKAILTEYEKVKKDVTGHIESYRFHLASEMLYEFIWHNFADIYVEAAKSQLAENASEQIRQDTQQILTTIYRDCLKLLHPFMPYVTEAMWQYIPHQEDENQLITAHWPISK